MKKILLILLCLPLLFTTCKKEEEKTSAPPSSSVCGNVTITVDGVNLSYNPNGSNLSLPACETLSMVYPNNNGGTIQMQSYSGLSNEWLLSATLVGSITFGQTYPSTFLGTPTVSFSFFDFATNYSYSNIDNNNTYNGSIIITGIDYTANLIEGNFSFIGHHNVTGTTKDIICNFSDVPFTPL